MFKILYVEDDPDDASALVAAVDRFNAAQPERAHHLQVHVVGTPDDVQHTLDWSFNAVLADVFFGGEDRLEDIIEHVYQCGKNRRAPADLPIVGYTNRGKPAFEACLAHSKRLYDILDKNAASPDYIVWRFSRLEQDISRTKPDSTIKRLVTSMEAGASWHAQVRDMAIQYDEHRTERRQVECAAHQVEVIADKLGTRDACWPLWESLVRWDTFASATSRGARTSGRHALNVFWLGYYLMHAPALSCWFSHAWGRLVDRRGDKELVQEVKPLEGFSTAWFYASLLHDVGKPVEKAKVPVSRLAELLAAHKAVVRLSGKPTVLPELGRLVERLLRDFQEPEHGFLSRAWLDGSARCEPDHGLVGAAELRSVTASPPQSWIIKEATRAIALHNIVGGLPESFKLSWDKEPLACLLVICDQLQTWDREPEPGEKVLTDDDFPQRAELSQLEIRSADGQRPAVTLTVNYIAPMHIIGTAIYERVHLGLEQALIRKPQTAFRRLGDPACAPFTIRVDYSLSGEPLSVEFRGANG